MHIDSFCIHLAWEQIIFFYFQQSSTDFSTISIFLFNMFYAKQPHLLPICRICFADLHAFVAFSFGCFCLGQTFLARQHQTQGQFCLWDLPVLEVSYLAGSCTWGRPAHLVRASQAGFSAAFTATWHCSETFSHAWVCAEPSPCCLPPGMFVLFDTASCSPQYTALVSYPTSSFCLSLQFVQFVKMILNCTYILTGICFIFVAPAGRISTHFPSLLLAKMLENMKPRTDTLWKWTSSNYPPAMTSQLYVPFSNSSEL